MKLNPNTQQVADMAPIPTRLLGRWKSDCDRLIARRLLCLVVFAFGNLIASVGAFGDETPDPRSESLSIRSIVDQPSTEVYPVHITIRGMRLNVPRNYINDARFLFGKIGLMLEMSLPRFEGATEDTIHCFYSKFWLQCPLVVEIAIPADEGPPGEGNPLVEAERNLPDHEMLFGLAKSKRARDVFLYFGSTEKEDLYIECNSYIESCGAHSVLGERVVFEYKYHRSQLKDWHTIHDNVTRIVNSFVAGNVR